MDFSSFNPLFSVSGLLVGILVGITGVGGGSLMTPLLVVLFGIHPATAVGTDLLYAAITKSAGTAVHGMNKTINWKVVGLLGLGSIPAALITLWMMAGVDRKSLGAVSFLTYSLGWMLFLTAFLLLFRKPIVDRVAEMRRHRPPVRASTVSALTVVLGLVLGTLVTLTSVGAGALGVTILLMLYPRLEIRDVVGSDIVHAVPLTLVGGLGYWMIGEIDWMMLISLLAGSIPGIIIGSHIAPRMPDRVIRPILAVTLSLVALKLVLS
ncbi:sulfite exporter TauE/SafE family protein [Rhizobium alvei]|uniref:Probable membrane transporter protein n=1 Tax=Rhizobium alvei TaxID=1132659 RepID=A0ABT8YKC0_9HYPH|nr:sulfite exporter TauE/SafE family protein [Rhizobium alvei]MDO6964100.1 sulfite exporter TauE/SafE family protein [Rhizobium alvei]